MYYICKFSDSWSLYDGIKKVSKPLEKTEIDCLKNLFPALLNDPGKILLAVQVNSIQPNKLMNLGNADKNGSGKKAKENGVKATAT
jgi:hypothetical protein